MTGLPLNQELLKGIGIAVCGGLLLVLAAMAIERMVDRVRERFRWRWKAMAAPAAKVLVWLFFVAMVTLVIWLDLYGFWVG